MRGGRALNPASIIRKRREPAIHQWLPDNIRISQRCGDGLVDLHGPHDHQSLLSKEYQLRLVDAFAGNGDLFRSYPDVFGRWQQTRKELDEFEAETALSNLDLWRHQLAEIQGAGIRAGERSELESQYSIAANGRRILELTGAGIALLSESENALLTQLGELARLLRELEKIDGQTHEFVEDHERATVELEELERSLVSYQQRVDLDPGALQMMEERLNLWKGSVANTGETNRACWNLPPIWKPS